jgi:hypothetical protein
MNSENARHRLQNQQTGVPAGAERNLITELVSILTSDKLLKTIKTHEHCV